LVAVRLFRICKTGDFDTERKTR